MATGSVRDFVASSAWGQLLTREQLERVLRDVSESGAGPGEAICRNGQRSDYWYGVVEGLVKVSNVGPDGKPTTLIGIPRGGWFGEGSVFKHERRPYDVVALRECRVAQVPADTFHWLLAESIAFNHYLIGQLNTRLAQFVIRCEHLRSYAPERHVALCLAELFNPVLYPGTTMTLQLSQEELSFLAGVSRGIVNRALRHLEQEGIVEARYGSIDIRDLAALRASAFR